jgi:hypothetical protein
MFTVAERLESVSRFSLRKSARISEADWQRRLRFFSIALKMTRSSSGDTSGFNRTGGTGDSLAVRGFQALCNLDRQIQETFDFDWPARDAVLRRHTVQVLHHEYTPARFPRRCHKSCKCSGGYDMVLPISESVEGTRRAY